MLISISLPERFEISGKEGFYIIPHLGADSVVEHSIGRELDQDEKFFAYGVADDVSNILEKHPELGSFDDRNFVVVMTEIRRIDQPASGGWRWDKLGEYIGNQNPKKEYIIDEENIDSVFVYRIFWIKS